MDAALHYINHAVDSLQYYDLPFNISFVSVCHVIVRTKCYDMSEKCGWSSWHCFLSEIPFGWPRNTFTMINYCILKRTGFSISKITPKRLDLKCDLYAFEKQVLCLIIFPPCLCRSERLHLKQSCFGWVEQASQEANDIATDAFGE